MKRWKISILFVIVIILAGSGIVLSGKWKDKSTVKKIEFSGSTTISKEELFDYAKLSDSLIVSNVLTLEMIESRISKHPNVKKANVTRNGSTIKIDITEKNPFATATNGKDVFLVDDQLTLYNLKKEQRDLDIPVISGLASNTDMNDYGKDDLKNLKIAQYIISQSIKLNKSLYNYISEISFADSNNIIIMTSDDATPVYFIEYQGLIKHNETLSHVRDINNTSLREEIKKKLLYLNGFLKQVRVYKQSGSFASIDMRYNDMIVVKNKRINIEQ
jgi:cell division septal protein FtsQ